MGKEKAEEGGWKRKREMRGNEGEKENGKVREIGEKREEK